MNYLLDVNAWVALIVEDHVHGQAAVDWYATIGQRDELWFCRVTQQGLLRLLTNRHVMKDKVLDGPKAWREFDTWRHAVDARFAAEPPGLEEHWRAATKSFRTGHNFWTDSYLAAFARATGCTLVTFDRALAGHAGGNVQLLPI